jgi:hypothetical protein
MNLRRPMSIEHAAQLLLRGEDPSRRGAWPRSQSGADAAARAVSGKAVAGLVG